MSQFLAFLAGLPSQFWSYFTGLIEKGMTFMAGIEWQQKIQEAAESKRLSDQLKAIIEAQRQINRIPVDGASDRLRNSRLNRANRVKERGIL